MSTTEVAALAGIDTSLWTSLISTPAAPRVTSTEDAPVGGGSNARDLEDLSKLIGAREERQYTESIGPDGRRSASSTLREVPVMDTSRLRMLPFGTAVLMLRAARPIVLTMTPWTARPDAAELQGSRRRLEDVIERASTAAQESLAG